MALALGGLFARGNTGFSGETTYTEYSTWSTTKTSTLTTTSFVTLTTATTTTDVTTDTTTDVTTDVISSIITKSVPITISLTTTDTVTKLSTVTDTTSHQNTVTVTNIRTITKLTSSTCPASTVTITKTTSSTCAGPKSTIYSADVYEYNPVPGVPPLATHYVSVDSYSKTSLVSIFCNTEVFREYFRPSIFNCGCSIGPIQTLNSVCDIVVGPIFTTGCDDNGIFVTQTGPRGTVIDLGTTATVSSCGTESVKTIAATPIVYGAKPTGTALQLSAVPISFGSTAAASTTSLHKRAASTVSTSGTVATVKTLISARGAQTSTSVL